MSEFEQRYEQLVKSFIDTAQQNFFGKVRELENAFFDKAVAQAQAELEEFAAGKLDDISEDAQVCLHPTRSWRADVCACMRVHTLRTRGHIPCHDLFQVYLLAQGAIGGVIACPSSCISRLPWRPTRILRMTGVVCMLVFVCVDVRACAVVLGGQGRGDDSSFGITRFSSWKN